MQFGVRIAFLLLLVAAAVSVKGENHGPHRWGGFSLFDRFRNSGGSSLNPKPAKATSEGFDLSDALGDLDPPNLKPKEQPKAPENSYVGLDLGDALRADDHGNVVQRLNKIIEQQNQQLRLLQQLMAKSSSCCLK